jgi:hypothetical protein
MAGTARGVGWRTIAGRLRSGSGPNASLEYFYFTAGLRPMLDRAPAARSSTLSELAAVAIIKNVPHAFGSDLFHSVGNPATIGVKRTILAARRS